MVLCMKVIGRMTRQMEEVALFMQMEMSMRVNGVMTKLMDSENTCILTVLNTKDIGKKISSMEKERKRGLMVLNTRETTLTERKMAMMGVSDGQMALLTKVSLWTTIFTVKEFMSGPITENTMESG